VVLLSLKYLCNFNYAIFVNGNCLLSREHHRSSVLPRLLEQCIAPLYTPRSRPKGRAFCSNSLDLVDEPGLTRTLPPKFYPGRKLSQKTLLLSGRSPWIRSLVVPYKLLFPANVSMCPLGDIESYAYLTCFSMTSKLFLRMVILPLSSSFTPTTHTKKSVRPAILNLFPTAASARCVCEKNVCGSIVIIQKPQTQQFEFLHLICG